MAEIRCPMCSRPNPEERDTCEFCGARLKPLTNELAAANVEPIHPGEEPTPKSTSELEKSLPEWLRNLRKGEGGQEEPSASEPVDQDHTSSDEDFYKTLSALGTAGGSFEPAPEEEQPVDDFLGRLSDLEGQTAAQLAEESESPATPSEPTAEDLLAGLTALEATSDTAATEEPVDWLAGLSSTQGEQDEETPAWLKEITSKVEQQAPPAAIAPEEEVDWRSQLEQEQQAAAAQPTQAEPEWRGFLGESEASEPDFSSQPVESEESLDWLKDLEAQASGAPPVTPSQPTPPAEESPDWLKPIAAAAAMGAAGQEEANPADETPEWLRGMQGVAGLSEASAEETPVPPEQELPDWLKSTQVSTGMNKPEEPEPESGSAVPSEEQGVPEWLKAATAAGATFETPKTEDVGGTQSEEPGIPDWAKAAGLAGATMRMSKPEEPASPEKNPVEAEEETSAEEPGIPDWLKAATAVAATQRMSKPEGPVSAEENPEEAAEAPGPVETTPEPVAPEPAEETPDWVKGLAAGAAVGALRDESGAAEAELYPASLPDWLTDIKPAEETAAAAALPPGEGPIEQAELPTWVQAMRPVEAAVGATSGIEEEEFTEDKGPLSGFSNVLPAAVGAAGVRRVSAYPNKLMVNESQQGQMQLLERLVASERTTKKVAARGRINSGRMLRWGIAAMLLVFVLLPIMFHTSITPSGKLNPPPLNSTIKAVDNLAPGATVLVVVDYQPAFSAELEAAAAPLLDQLRLKGATVVFISSTATGSALADRLVARVDQDLSGTAPQQYLNLGYLTGGPSGITSFVTNPTGTAPQTIGGEPAWQLPPLQNIQSISDFSAMVVLTDSSDTGAIWIEQSRQPLGEAPLLMALSAQAEPMLQPYYDSGQVQGMVTGLPGGVAYEQANGIASIGSSYWDPFSVGFLVAEIIVAFGGVVALLMAWQSRRKRPAGEAQ